MWLQVIKEKTNKRTAKGRAVLKDLDPSSSLDQAARVVLAAAGVDYVTVLPETHKRARVTLMASALCSLLLSTSTMYYTL